MRCELTLCCEISKDNLSFLRNMKNFTLMMFFKQEFSPELHETSKSGVNFHKVYLHSVFVHEVLKLSVQLKKIKSQCVMF